MDAKKFYDVDLYVGHDILGSSADRVTTLVSRQMLCDMTSKIEYNIRKLNENSQLGSSDCAMGESFYDGLNYRNLNYIITGVRGSGKSTFLNYLILSLTRAVDPFDEGYVRCRNRYSAQFYIGEPRKQVRCQLLSRFDPSFPCYSRGGFLISVVAAIQTQLGEISRKAYQVCDHADLVVMQCNQELKKLDKAISRLTHQRESWEELSEYQVAHLRTENADLEKLIRACFHKILELLCRLCSVDAFIVSIDDADTNFGKCAYVLEDLRLYMTSTRLVVLMAGDKDLYLERIRELHFGEYNKDYHQADAKGKGYRMDFVMNHASQYLIKLFPLENQYELRDLNYLADKIDPIRCILHARIDTKHGMMDVSCNLFDFIKHVFSAAINTKDLCIDNFTRLFLRMPLRSVIQVLNSWTLDNVWTHLYDMECIDQKGNALYSSKMAKAENELLLRGFRNLVKDAVFSVMRNEIRFDDYSFRKINLESSRDFYMLMQAMCRNMNDVEHGYFLTGSTCRNYSNQFVALLLALSAHNYLKGLQGFLSYFLYGPASVSLYAKALKQLHHNSADPVDEKILSKFNDDFSQYLHISSWESPSRWARHANMIWCFDEGREGMHLGILRLRYSVLVKKLNEAVFTVPVEIMGSEQAVTDRIFHSIALSVSMSRSEARDNSYFISVFGFLAFILKCVTCCERVSKSLPDERDEKEIVAACSEALYPMVNESVHIKPCRNPEWLISHEDEINNNTEQVRCSVAPSESENGDAIAYEQRLNGIFETALQTLVGKIAHWYIKYVQEVNPQEIENDLSPQQMGRFWTRFYHNLKQDIYSVPKLSLNSKPGRSDMQILGETLDVVSAGFERVFLAQEEVDKQPCLSLRYRSIIYKFPLSPFFVKGCNLYAEKLKEEQDVWRWLSLGSELRKCVYDTTVERECPACAEVDVRASSHMPGEADSSEDKGSNDNE